MKLNDISRKISYFIVSIIAFCLIVLIWGFNTECSEGYCSALNACRNLQVSIILCFFYFLMSLIVIFNREFSTRFFIRMTAFQMVMLVFERSFLLGIYSSMPDTEIMSSIIVALVTSFVLFWIQFLLLCKSWCWSKPEISFVILSVPLLLLYLVLLTPVSICDSYSHLVSSYRFSNLILGEDENDGYMMQVEDYAFLASISDDYEFGKTTVPRLLGYEQILKSVSERRAEELDGVMIETPNYEHMAYYSMLNWMPQTIGLTIGRVAGLNPFWVFTLARIFIAAVYLSIAYYSIRISPICKSILWGASLFPICIDMATSFNYDSMVFISIIGFMANVFRMKYSDKKSNWSWLIQTLVFSFLLGGVKGGGFLPVVILGIVWSAIKSDITKSSTLLLSGAGSYVLFNKVLPSGIQYFQLDSLSGITMSANYAIYHPFRYLSRIIYMYFSQLQYLMGSAIGTRIAANEKTIPLIFIIGILICIVIIAVWERDCEKLSIRDRRLMQLLVVLGILFTPATVLVGNLPEVFRIVGTQGRYYFPVVVIFMILFAHALSSKIKLNHTEKIIGNAKMCVMLFEYISVMYMIELYFSR